MDAGGVSSVADRRSRAARSGATVDCRVSARRRTRAAREHRAIPGWQTLCLEASHFLLQPLGKPLSSRIWIWKWNTFNYSDIRITNRTHVLFIYFFPDFICLINKYNLYLKEIFQNDERFNSPPSFEPISHLLFYILKRMGREFASFFCLPTILEHLQIFTNFG